MKAVFGSITEKREVFEESRIARQRHTWAWHGLQRRIERVAAGLKDNNCDQA